MVAKSKEWFEWFGLPALVAVLVIVALAMTGCATIPPQDKVPNMIPAVGTNLNKTDAFITSAEQATQAAVKHTDAAGQEDLKQVTTSHKAAQASNAAATKELAAVSTERDSLKKIAADAQAAEAKYKNSWGYRGQVWLTRFAILLITLFALHYLLGGAAIVITLFVPALVFLSPILKLIATVVNPAAWFQFLIDHVHCNSTATTSTVVSAVGTPVSPIVQDLEKKV